MAQQQINGTQILVGKPDDGSYGQTPSNINVPGISPTDNLPSAIDKLISIIDKLAPAKSPLLSTKFLSPQGLSTIGPYTARHTATNSIWSSGYGGTISATAGTAYSSIYTTSNPVVFVSDSPSRGQGQATFSDGQSGTLIASVDGNPVGTRTLDATYYGPNVTGSPDVSTWRDTGLSGPGGGLTITFDQDPYSVAPNTGFWTSLKATMSSTYSFVVDGNEHYYNMQHTTTGTSNQFRFIYDNNVSTSTYNTSYTGVPTVSGITFSISLTLFTQSSTRWTSGVPSLSISDYILASYSIPNNGGLVSRFYNTTRITTFRMTASSSVSVDDANTLGIPLNGVPSAYQNPYRVSGITAAVATNMFSLNSGYDALFTIPVYNPMGTSLTDVIGGIYFGSVTSFTGRKLYIDTVSNESIRVRSGDGQYPSFGTGTYSFGSAYSPTFSSYSINDPSNFPQVCGELMLQNGIFRSPFGDWSNNYPVSGPTYSPLNNNGANAYQNPPFTYWRWATFKIATISSKSAIGINIINSNISGATSSEIISDMAIYATVVNGSVQQIGWIDANKSYNTGSPTASGDPALVVANSDGFKYVTFGTNTWSGDVYVRIGFPSGSTKQFGSVTYKVI